MNADVRFRRVTGWVFVILAVVSTTWAWSGLPLRELLVLVTR